MVNISGTGNDMNWVFISCHILWKTVNFYQPLSSSRNNGNKVNFLEYLSIIKSVPKEWLKVIKHKINTEISGTGKQLVQNNMKCTKKVYWYLIEKKQSRVAPMRLKWEEMLNLEITDDMWNQSYVKTMCLTNSTKLRFFQYRLINGYILTNVRVSKWDPQVDPKCTFCHQQDETLLHLFVECVKVNHILKLLKRWLYHFCFIQFDLEAYVIIFNAYKDAFPNLVNTIILIAKYYIFVQKVKSDELSFQALICSISKYKRIEEIIAIRSGKLNKHRKKWKMYERI